MSFGPTQRGSTFVFNYFLTCPKNLNEPVTFVRCALMPFFFNAREEVTVDSPRRFASLVISRTFKTVQ